MQSTPAKFRTVFLIVVLLGQASLYALRWWRSDVLTSDFPYFFVVAHLYESGQNPYDLKSQCRAQTALRNDECAGYAHTPFLLPALALLFNDNIYSSYWRWALVQLFLLAICVYLLYQISGDIFASLQCAVFPPVVGGLLIGNDTIFIMTALLGWATLLLRKKDFWAGLCLSLMILKPHLALPLAIGMLFVRPRAFGGFCIGGFILTLYSFFLVGLEGFYGIIEVTGSLSKGATFGGVSQAFMFNTTGLLARAGLSTVWAWPIYVVGIAAVALLLARRGVTRLSLSFATIITVFTCPHLFLYDFAYLTLPLVNAHPLAPMIGSLVTGLILVGLPWWTVYLMMALLAYFVAKKMLRDIAVPRPADELSGP